MRRPFVIAAAAATLVACGGRVSNVGPGSPDTRDGGSGGSAGSGGNSSGGVQSVTTDVDGSIAVFDAGTFSPGFPELSRKLSSLDAAERKQFCVEDARRSDLCQTEGLQKTTEAECDAVVSACRKTLDPTVSQGCDDPRDLGDCDVTLGQFFACVAAWNPTQTCSKAGVAIDTPHVCKAVSDCPEFRFAFQQFGRAPRCDPATTEAPPKPMKDDVYGVKGCFPVPKRFVTLGNSIGNCGGMTGCAQEELHEYLAANYAPGLTYEKHTASGGDFVDLARQMKLVDGGPGHVAVWIYSFPATPDDKTFDLWKSQLKTVLDYFSDESLFADGATFLLNTQYSPSDQCPSPPGPNYGFLTLDQEQLLQNIDQMLFIDLAGQRSDTVTVDQYWDWLGHGWNAGVEGCPYCLVDSTLWEIDSLHPNAAGQEHIFQKWKGAVDRMYGSACR